MSVFTRGSVKFKNIEIAQGGVKIGVGGIFDLPVTNYFVDGTLGVAGNSGLGWGTGVALTTISQAMTKITTLATRGRARIFVAPGGYTEDIQTPLNADGPHCALEAVNPLTSSWGAAYVISTAAATPSITVRARGWGIYGFELESPTGAAAVLLQRNSGGTVRSSGTTIAHNFIGATITGKYGVEFEGADTYIYIHDNDFSLLQATGGAGIFCNTTPTALPLFCRVENNVFRENTNHIAMGASWGFNAATIRGNTFQSTGDKSATKILDLSGGRNNSVNGNYFNIDNGTGSGQYDESSGKVLAGTNDNWSGNYINSGLTDKNPGSGA